MRKCAIFALQETKTLLWGPDGSRDKKAVALCCLAAVVLLVPLVAGTPPLRGREALLWERVRGAQSRLLEERERMGIPANEATDPWETGLIGVEWSPVSTTTGDLESKRTSTDPRWAIVFLGWYRSMGLQRGDRVAILASGSFPGFTLSALLAAEEAGLEVFLALSLAASSWGANIPGFLITNMLEVLRDDGFIPFAPGAVTLGGAGELARDLSPEGRRFLLEAIDHADVALLESDSYEALLGEKWGAVAAFLPKAIVQIGGSQANLGTDPEVLDLPPGIILPERGKRAGNGMIAMALDAGIPVIHMLDVRSMCRQAGIPYDGSHEKAPPRRIPRSLAVSGVAVWAAFLIWFRRWSMGKGETSR